MELRCLAIGFLLLAGCGRSPDAHYQRGRLLHKQGKLTEAMREAEAGLRAEPSWRFRILKADVLLARSDVAAARALLDSSQPPTGGESLARLRMAQGYAEYLTSNYSRADALLQQAAEAAKPLGLPFLDSLIENRMGLVEVQQGQRDAAERNFRHVIEVAGAQDDPYLQSTAEHNLGFLFENAFRFEDAIYWFEKASGMFQQLGNMNSYYVALGNLGTCYLRLGDLDKGLEDLGKAETHARQIGDHYLEQLWIGNGAEALYDRGDLSRAEPKFQQALAVAKTRDKNEKDSTGWWYFNLASLSIDLGDFEKAEFYNKEAMIRRQAMADRSDFYPRVNEANIAAGRKDPRAEGLYRALISEYHEGINPVQMLEARAGLARLLAEKGEFDQADAQFRTALVDVESQRTALASPDNRLTYLAKLIRFYDRYINFLVDRGQPERALEAAESSRARVLDETLESKSKHAAVSAAFLAQRLSFLLAGEEAVVSVGCDCRWSYVTRPSAGEPDRAVGGRIPVLYRESARSAAIRISGGAQVVGNPSRLRSAVDRGLATHCAGTGPVPASAQF
jgi:tetratricopeptide (TPR) repeat protein